MLQINNYTNFKSGNIREAIRNGDVNKDNPILLLYLYSYLNGQLKLML